jgi:hypothetical protein
MGPILLQDILEMSSSSFVMLHPAFHVVFFYSFLGLSFGLLLSYSNAKHPLVPSASRASECS